MKKLKLYKGKTKKYNKYINRFIYINTKFKELSNENGYNVPWLNFTHIHVPEHQNFLN